MEFIIYRRGEAAESMEIRVDILAVNHHQLGEHEHSL